MDAVGSARVDSWLWAVRLCKMRSLATAACRAGHVRVNGDRAKAAQPVRVGDEARVRIAGFDRILVVRVVLVKRVGALVADESYLDISPPLPTRDELARDPQRERGAGRPTKRERREMEKLRGRE